MSPKRIIKKAVENPLLKSARAWAKERECNIRVVGGNPQVFIIGEDQGERCMGDQVDFAGKFKPVMLLAEHSDWLERTAELELGGEREFFPHFHVGEGDSDWNRDFAEAEAERIRRLQENLEKPDFYGLLASRVGAKPVYCDMCSLEQEARLEPLMQRGASDAAVEKQANILKEERMGEVLVGANGESEGVVMAIIGNYHARPTSMLHGKLEAGGVSYAVLRPKFT